MNLFAFHEWNQKRQGWAKNLDSDLSVVFNREISDNQNKFSRWAAQSMLGGVTKIKLAFVQRADDRSNESHKVVGTHSVDTASFCQQINLQMKNCWAIVEDVVSTVNHL